MMFGFTVAAGLGSLFPLLIVVFVVISALRALKQAQQAREEHEAGSDETAEQQRVREIRERLRRAAAERRGETLAPRAEPPPLVRPGESATRPLMRPVPPLDPFGGPMRKFVTTLERKIAEALPPAQQRSVSPTVAAEREEQRIQEEQAITAARVAAQHRAAQAAAEAKLAAESESALREAARSRLLGDLRDTESVRRAFVLREVLGPPVGLR